MQRRTRKILTGFAIFIVAVAIVYAALLVRATVKLRHAYAALAAAGRPLRIDEIVPPKVPDSANAVVLYQSAVLLLKSESAGDKSVFERLTDRRWRPKGKEELNALLGQETVSRAVALIDEGTRRPVCQLDRDDSNDLNIFEFSQTDEEKLSTVLAARGQFEIDAAQWEKAWELVGTQLRFAASLRTAPVFTTQRRCLYRIAGICRTIQKLCETAPPSYECSRTLQDLLKQLDDVKPLLRALDAERLLVGERFFSLSRDELSQFLWKEMGGGGGDGLPLPVAKAVHRLTFTLLAFKPRLVADHAAYLQLMGQRVELLQGPYRPPEEASRFLNTSRWNALASLLGASGGYESRDFCQFAAMLRLTRAGLALLQYRQTHGAFPQTLEALGLEGFVDPYTDQPLHYRPEGQGFVLYSVGSDRKDNNGTPEPQRRSDDPRRKAAPYDEVWRFPHPKEHDTQQKESAG